MAVTARFNADFASFFDAVSQADIKLKQLEDDGGKVTTSLTRVANSFSGQKIIQDANLAAEAINRIGGVSQLTAAEQTKVNATVTEAIAKYQALGQVAPQALTQIAAQTKDAGEKTSQFGDLVGRLTERFAIYEVLRGALDFSKSILADSAAFEDLSKATGISTDGIQQLAYVGAEFGLGVDQMARGVETLSSKLARGDGNAVAAVKELGLNVNTLLSKGPQEAFLEIADAAGRIQDPMLKDGIAAQLFGERLGRTLVPALGDMRKAIEAVPQTAIINEATIKSAHDFEVELGHLTTQAKVFAEETVANLVNGTTLVNAGFGTLGAAVAKLSGSFESGKKAGDTYLPTEVSDRASVLKNYLTSLRSEGVEPLNAAQKNAIDIMHAHGDSMQLMTSLTGASEGAIKTYIEAHKQATDAVKRDQEATQKYADTISGAALNDKVKEIASALRLLQSQGPLTAGELQKVGEEAEGLYKKGAVLTPQLADIRQAFSGLNEPVKSAAEQVLKFSESVKLTIPASVAMGQASQELTDKIKIGFGSIGEAGFKVSDGFAKAAKDIDAYNKQTQTSLAELGRAFNVFGGVVGGTLGNLIQSVGAFSSSILTATKDFGSAAAAFGSGNLLAGIASTAAGILSIGSAAISAGKAVVGFIGNLFGLGSAGRDAVTSFASSMGGFDALHVQLDALGASGEQLWIKLTQGVGKNNPQQAQQVIKEVTDALNKQKAAADQNTATTEQQAIATVQSATEAQAALQALTPLIKQNEDDWSDWRDKVNAVVNDVAGALKSLQIPNGLGVTVGAGASNASIPRLSSSSGGAGGVVGVNVSVPLTLNGSTLAEANARTVLSLGR